MRFRLRTLLIVLALGPICLASVYWKAEKHIRHKAARARLDAAFDIGLQEGLRVWHELIATGQLDQDAHVPFHDPRRAVADGGAAGRVTEQQRQQAAMAKAAAKRGGVSA